MGLIVRILGVDPGLDGGLAIVDDGALVWAAKIPWEDEPIIPVGGVRGDPVYRLQSVFHELPCGDVDEAWFEHPLLAIQDRNGKKVPGNPLLFAHFGMLVNEVEQYHLWAKSHFVYPGSATQPHCWQAWAFAGLKGQIQTDAYADLGLPAAGLKDEALWFTRLACLVYFGEQACRDWLIAPKRGAKTERATALHDGLCDAALIALFGWDTHDWAHEWTGAWRTIWQADKLQAAWPELFQPRAALPPRIDETGVPF